MSDIGKGLSQGEAALAASEAELASAFSAAGRAQAPTAALSVGVSMRKLTMPPAVVGAVARCAIASATCVGGIPASFRGIRLVHDADDGAAADLGRQWLAQEEAERYEDVEYGLELKVTVMPRPPSAG